MRKTVLLLSVVLCVTAGNVYGQEKQKNVTDSFYNELLVKALERVVKQARYTLWGDISSTDIVNDLELVNMPFERALDTLLKPLHYSWKFIGRIVHVTKNELKGKVSNKSGEPVVGANISMKRARFFTTSDEAGGFIVFYKDTNDILEVTSVGYKKQERRIGAERFIQIQLEDSATTLSGVSVKGKVARLSTDSLAVNMVIGSVTELDKNLFNASPAFNFLDRLEANCAGVTMPVNILPNQNQSTVAIRSRSTVEGNVQPLIILDNIPYSGNLNNLNNDDIERVSVLKDAASTSIRGVLAGNGVIAIESKTGRYNQKMNMAFNLSATGSRRPDVFDLSTMSSPDFIEAEQQLFDYGTYNNIIQNSAYGYLSPVVEALHQKRMGLITHSMLDSILSSFRKADVRRDVIKYLYRPSLSLHGHIGVSGGNSNQHFYGSIGYDQHASTLARNGFKRITGNVNHTLAFGNQRAEVNIRMYYSLTHTDNNGIDPRSLKTPYERLADDHGNLLSQSRDYRRQYIDTAGGGKLLGWEYKLLEELQLNDNTMLNEALQAAVSLKYKVRKGLTAHFSFRREMEQQEARNHHAASSYFTRDLKNKYSSIDNGRVTRYLPAGGILDKNTSNHSVNNLNGRLQYSFATRTSALEVYAGGEVRHLKISHKLSRNYGYQQGISTTNIDYSARYPLYHEPLDHQPIPLIDDRFDTVNHFYAFYLNGNYTFRGRYAASVSVRKDESNIFGVQANQKGVPLWSLGAGWEISQEPFFQSGFIALLRARVSHGYCGNISRSVSALATALTVNTNPYGAPVSVIVNPPNPSLQWEQIGISNLGIDFSVLKNRLSGTIEGYLKTGKYLFGLKPVDPTNGMELFNGNVAAMKGGGLDVTIHASIIQHKKFQWSNILLASYVRDKVTDYKVMSPAIGYYCDQETLNPLEGFPLYSIHAFDFRGLDPATGDPIGMLNGHESKDYAAIIQSKDLRNLAYYGPATPTFFGSLRNTFSWNGLNLSFTIAWKAGHFFRRPSIKNADLVNGSGAGHADFSRRWRKPGDEKITNIPSFNLPLNPLRDIFFSYSSALVEKGDHIRWKDFRLSYIISKQSSRSAVKPSYECFIYGSNIGILWKANKEGIDPDHIYNLPNPLSITIGVSVNF